ncbi:MAG: AAA family ATPase [Dehalococcoidia bacterium]|nr:AAA family ATPase [Myxococcales bacterium]MCB9492239.1 AAA family ATPase [Dehalococcoidia bacterium]MCB9507862.1 AAA family ATPase [Myxococcales bacterium]
MARSDLLLDLVRAGARGDQGVFRKALEALVAEERAKQHHVLADRLAAHLHNGNGNGSGPAVQLALTRRNEPSPLYGEVEPRRGLDDLILPPLVQESCRELVEEQHRGDLLRSHGLEPRHRVLLAGPPGNGKTSLAEALASELAVPLLVVRYEAVIASFLGETAVRLSRLFEQTRSRRCVLFFDEFDVVGKERGDVHETGEIKRVVSSLLLQVDALPSYVVVVTATNHPELLDRAVWRRFQLRLRLPPPSAAMIQEWLARFERRLGAPLGTSSAVLAKRLRGLSFSEVEQFGLDVQRRYVLSLPNADAASIVKERLKHWEHRFSLGDDDDEVSGA